MTNCRKPHGFRSEICMGEMNDRPFLLSLVSDSILVCSQVTLACKHVLNVPFKYFTRFPAKMFPLTYIRNNRPQISQLKDLRGTSPPLPSATVAMAPRHISPTSPRSARIQGSRSNRRCPRPCRVSRSSPRLATGSIQNTNL